MDGLSSGRLIFELKPLESPGNGYCEYPSLPYGVIAGVTPSSDLPPSKSVDATDRASHSAWCASSRGPSREGSYSRLSWGKLDHGKTRGAHLADGFDQDALLVVLVRGEPRVCAEHLFRQRFLRLVHHDREQLVRLERWVQEPLLHVRVSRSFLVEGHPMFLLGLLRGWIVVLELLASGPADVELEGENEEDRGCGCNAVGPCLADEPRR